MKMSTYQQIIATSKYARYLDDKGRRETWEETVDRYMNFVSKKIPDNNELWKVKRKEIREAIVDFEVMPSMRALLTAGEAAERENLGMYNCSYLAINSKRCFSEVLYLLMNAAGVGFSCERQEVNKLPSVPDRVSKSDDVIVVQDSKRGWAVAYNKLISSLYDGEIPSFDYSKLRPAGARLKTFGGRSSGGAVLKRLFDFVSKTFVNASGRKLNSIEVHDIMCMTGEIVIAGSVRRSALISLSNLTDLRMREAKSGQWWTENPQRSLANNSVAYTEKPDMEAFMAEWTSLVKSKSGERGIFNRVAAKKQAGKYGKRLNNQEFGINPCLHPDSLVQTIKGEIKIKDITSPTMVYTMDKNGKLSIKKCSASWISKKDAKTIEIEVAFGRRVKCTKDHKIYIRGKGWVDAGNVVIGDRVVHLNRVRRGACYSGVKLTTQVIGEYQMEHRLVWSAVNGSIPEYHDIHHIDGNTYNNDISNLECLSHSKHATLTRMECSNDHMVNGPNSKVKSGYGFISPANSRHGAKRIINMPDILKSKLHQYPAVTGIYDGDVTDVYDLTVEDTHNFICDFTVVHNCGEISLRSKQLCNLTEVVVRPNDTWSDLNRKIELAAILGTIQSSYTDFKFVSEEWKRNCDEERLLGVSLTGIMDSTLTNGKAHKDSLPGYLSMLRKNVEEVNKVWAEVLGIRSSVATTTLKPSGTVSQLVDSSSGIHARHSKYYIRRIRMDKKDPMYSFMKEQGLPVEDEVFRPESTAVFSFPMKSPDNSVTRTDRTAIEQLELWLLYKQNYCEHQASITVSVKDHEWMEVGAWVYKYFDDLSGVSFLPFSDHTYQQAPYEDITEDEYIELKKNDKDIDFSLMREFTDNTESAQTLACTAAGGCEI